MRVSSKDVPARSSTDGRFNHTEKMSRDVKELKQVSELFTEDILKEIIKKAKNCDEKDVINVESWDFGSASRKGDSYLSMVSRVTLKATINDGQKVQVKIVVKALPSNIGRRKTYRSVDFFKNEVAFYSEVVPRFEEFLLQKGQKSLLNVPKCLAYVLDGENDFIAMEDAGTYGFQQIVRQSCLELDQISFILKALAKFHAISFAYKDQRQDFNSKIAESIFETYFSEDLWNWYGRFYERLVEITKDALAKEYPKSEAERRFNSYKAHDIYSKSAKLCSRAKEATSVVNHGDCWLPNFLIHDNEIMILDFQLARCTSPVLDIAFLIYTSTDKKLRHHHFDHLLDIYYNELSRIISLLGSNPEKVYSRDVFMSEVKEQFFHGLTFAIEAVQFSVLDESTSFDLDVIKGENAVNIADVWTVSNITNKESRRRLADVVVHATERNFI